MSATPFDRAVIAASYSIVTEQCSDSAVIAQLLSSDKEEIVKDREVIWE